MKLDIYSVLEDGDYEFELKVEKLKTVDSIWSNKMQKVRDN